MNIDWYMQCFIHGVKEVYVVGGGGVPTTLAL